MPAADMPAAEVSVTEELVHGLIRRQLPHLADRTITLVSNGWDNVLFRIGDDLVARLPRREVAVPLLVSEQRWLPMLALRLPIPIPAPLHAGVPDLGYPWPWSVCPYFAGESALARLDRGDELADPAGDAVRLGRFFAALHQPAPDNAPENPFRGVPLAARDERNQDSLDRLADTIDARRVAELWARARDAPPWDGPKVWVHGDPHPGNMIVDEDGHLAAVIDFGDITAGDPATDLSSAWMLLPREVRTRFRTETDADDATWRRAHGWALTYGLVLLAGSADNPPYARLGQRVLAAALDDVPA